MHIKPYSIRGRLPRSPGASPLAEDASDDPTRPGEDDRPPAFRTLAELAREHQLFSHGLLFTQGHLLAEPLRELADASGEPLDILMLTLDWVLFPGMAEYQSLLFACPLEVWDGVKAFLGQVGGVQRQRGVFWRVLIQKVPLVDRLALKNVMHHEQVPTVDVYVFGVDGNKGIWAVGEAGCVRRHPPEEETMLLSRAVLGHDRHPYRSVDPDYTAN